MNLIYLSLILSLFYFFTSAYEYSELQCVVCKAVIKEINKTVLSEGSTKTVEVGGYAMDSAGNVKKKRKLLVKSEIFLSETMDKVCDKMSDYIRATEKQSGKLVLVNLGDMTSKPSLAEVDIIQDSDLNRSLEHQCKVVTEEFEDDILEVFTKGSATPVEDICIKSTDLCEPEAIVHYEL